MNDRLGTVVEDGGAAAGANVTGFFRLTDTGVEVRYADGRGELLTATPDGGVSMQRSGVGGESSCRSWYPDGHAFSEADKKQALAEYASRLGLGPAPKTGCEASAPPQARLRPSDAKPREKPSQVKPVSLHGPVRMVAPAEIAALAPVTVRESVIHTIDAGRAAGGDDQSAFAAGRHSARPARCFGLPQGRKRWQSLGLPQCLRL